MEEFIKEFAKFREKAMKTLKPEFYPEEQIVQLFAIYRKDLRTAHLNGETVEEVEPATERQKQYIRDLLKQNHLSEDYVKKPIDELTIQEASKLIDALRGQLGIR